MLRLIVMNRFIFFLSMLLYSTMAFSQGVVKGRVLDKISNEPLSYVNVRISPQGSETLLKGAVTDIDGKFAIDGLKNGDYTLTLTFVGYKNYTKNFSISSKNSSHHYAAISQKMLIP